MSDIQVLREDTKALMKSKHSLALHLPYPERKCDSLEQAALASTLQIYYDYEQISTYTNDKVPYWRDQMKRWYSLEGTDISNIIYMGF